MSGYFVLMKRFFCVALLLVITSGSPGWALEESPPPLLHRLQRGQTLAALSRLYSVPLEALLQLNADMDPHRLEVGCLIKIPRPESGWSLELSGPVEPELKSQEAPPDAVAGLWEAVTMADGRKAWAPRLQMLIPSPVPLPPQDVVARAQRFLGAPYTWGGQSPNGVDCSGFVHEVFRLSGHQLPRLADEQFAQTLEIEEPQPGDLVFFSTYLPGPSHVGISLGGRDFLHASSTRGVIQASLEDDYFKSRYLGSRRLPAWVEGPLGRL